MITSALENDNVNYKHVFPCSTVVENPLASGGDTEMRVSSLGREDPLGTGHGNRSSILAWKIPRTEEPGESQRVGQTEHAHIYIIINETDDTWKNPIYYELSYKHGDNNRAKSTESGVRGPWVKWSTASYHLCVFEEEIHLPSPLFTLSVKPE